MVDFSIALIGFMATGKSTISRTLSKRLNLELIDTDKTIEEKIGMTISEIFEKYGENGFRDIESDVIKDLKDKKQVIISFGGGVCLREENIKNIKKNHRVILLESSPETIFERVSRNIDRPVLKGNTDIKSIEEIMKIRKPSYRKCAHLIIDTEGKNILEIVNEIIKELGIE